MLDSHSALLELHRDASLSQGLMQFPGRKNGVWRKALRQRPSFIETFFQSLNLPVYILRKWSGNKIPILRIGLLRYIDAY